MYSYSVSGKGKVMNIVIMVFLCMIIIGLIGKIYSDRLEAQSVTEVDDSPAEEANIESIVDSFEVDCGAGADVPIINATLASQSSPFLNLTNNPQFVIYHTHDCEAYTMTSTCVYEEIGECRTDDDNYSVIRIGKELQNQMYQQFSINGVHDTTSHEYPKLSTAYSRSLTTASAYIQTYNNALLLDIHRDAYTKNSWDPAYVVIDGKRVARILVVVGKGEGYDERGDYTQNLAYAKALTDALNEIHPQLARPVKTKEGRYNQHLSSKALLIEVGHHKNTLDEALAATKYLAQALNEAFFSNP